MALRGIQPKATAAAVKDLETIEPATQLIDTRRLAALLAYPSANAIRHAHRRGRLAVPLFHVPGRRGLFARINDVTSLLSQGLQQAHPPAPKGAPTEEEVS